MLSRWSLLSYWLVFVLLRDFIDCACAESWLERRKLLQIHHWCRLHNSCLFFYFDSHPNKRLNKQRLGEGWGGSLQQSCAQRIFKRRQIFLDRFHQLVAFLGTVRRKNSPRLFSHWGHSHLKEINRRSLGGSSFYWKTFGVFYCEPWGSLKNSLD